MKLKDVETQEAKEYFQYVISPKLSLSCHFIFIFGDFIFCHILESMKNGHHNFDPVAFLHDECPSLKGLSF